jgi:hypothetical protein
MAPRGGNDLIVSEIDYSVRFHFRRTSPLRLPTAASGAGTFTTPHSSVHCGERRTQRSRSCFVLICFCLAADSRRFGRGALNGRYFEEGGRLHRHWYHDADERRASNRVRAPATMRGQSNRVTARPPTRTRARANSGEGRRHGKRNVEPRRVHVLTPSFVQPDILAQELEKLKAADETVELYGYRYRKRLNGKKDGLLIETTLYRERAFSSFDVRIPIHKMTSD